MDLPWGDEKTIQFITNVGLITSRGKHGDNIMSAEWTHHVSYSPGLIAVSIGKNRATLENIKSSREFGVSIVATDQNVMASVAGSSSGRDIDKIKALKELGFKFYKAKKIDTLMAEGAVLNVECKLINQVEAGDHILLIGEIVDVQLNKGKEPLAYHKLKFWKLEKNIEKPNEKELEKIRSIVQKNKK